jgi:phosphatidylglycerol---prolipoprotein diacylglyceryl transferase
MYRELFTIPGLNFTIYGYGLALVVACFASMSLAKFLARRCGLNPEYFVNIVILGLLSGVLGARISHILENLPDYTDPKLGLGQNLLNMINLRHGGLTYYGGFLLATPTCILYGLWRKIPLLRGMDIIAPCLMVGLAIGRVGCFLNGCCWGGACTLPWAVQFPYGSPPYEAHVEERKITPPAELIQDSIRDIATGRTIAIEPRILPYPELNLKQLAIARQQKSLAVHPTQLYSTITAGLIALVCLAYFSLSPKPGTVFGLMMILEGAGRFTIEQMRVNETVLHVGSFGLSLSMTIGLGLFIAGLVMWPAARISR